MLLAGKTAVVISGISRYAANSTAACTYKLVTEYSSFCLPLRGNIITLQSCVNKDTQKRLPLLCVEEVESSHLLLERNNVFL